MNLPEIRLPTTTVSLPIERLRTGVASTVRDNVHSGNVAAMLQDLYDSHVHNMGSIYAEDPVWYSLSGNLEKAKGKIAKLALHGWTEAADACRALFKQVVATHTSTFLQTLAPTDEPGDVDVAAYLADADLQFITASPSRQTAIGNGGIVTLEHEIFSSAKVSSRDIVLRGVMVAAAVYMLERAGVRVKVIARLTGHGAHANHAMRDHRITVKEAADMVHIGRLLYWLAHPSVHRVILFAIRKRLWDEDSYSPSYGALPIHPKNIRTPGQVGHAQLEAWLAKTLQDVGLTFR
jgi:hypothetical protein